MTTRTAATDADARTLGPEQLVEQVRERYAKIAEATGASCCGPKPPSSCCGGEADYSVQIGYRGKDLAAVPVGSDLSLGCGAPVDLLDLKPGETVLDLGSGGGLDAFLAAKRVGSSGHVIGVDMTPAMLAKARANAQRGGYANVEFREGRLEALPVADASVDAVTSNCVVNLVPDKGKVFKEVGRVLKPGGRLVISDILLDGKLPAAIERDLLAYSGCVAGAIPREQYFALVEAAGLGPVDVLRDVDWVTKIAEAAPQEVNDLVERLGVPLEELRGKIRSVTFRAVRH